MTPGPRERARRAPLIDRALRRALGVLESPSPEALFRLRPVRAARAFSLPDGEVPQGARLVELHMWNERLPLPPPGGHDLAWARHLYRQVVCGLRVVARQMAADPRLQGGLAVGGPTVLFSPDRTPATRALMSRLGFRAYPGVSPLGRPGDFAENLYAWYLMRAFHAARVPLRQMLRLRRVEVWMSAGELFRRYGPGP